MKIIITRLAILLFFLSLFHTDVFAQVLFGKKLEGMECVKPCDCYKAPSGTEENEKCSLCAHSKEMPGRSKFEKYWQVYSDREDNPTYVDQNFSKPTGFTLSYMQACIVAQEAGNAVRLVKWSYKEFVMTSKGKDQVFKNNAEDLGWIEKKKLLLWKNSLIDDSTRFSKKAVSVKKLEDKKNMTITSYISNHGILDLFNAPMADKKSDLDRELKMFQYLFIYKEDNGMYLLGKTNEMVPAT
ncbi:MAG: type VI secretion system protein TssR domain-containing protein, partial [Bacteroidota bacterium]